MHFWVPEVNQNERHNIVIEETEEHLWLTATEKDGMKMSRKMDIILMINTSDGFVVVTKDCVHATRH